MSKYIGATAVNLSTTSADVTGNADIGGNLTVDGNLSVSGTTTTIDSASAQTVDLGDNDKIRLGDGDDLQIFHDGSNSFINNTVTGALSIKSDDINLMSSGSENMATFVEDGAVTLYHDNAAKLATTSTGALVQSSADSKLTIRTGNNTGFSEIHFGDSDADNRGQIYYHHTNDFMAFATGGSERMRIDSSGNLLVGKTSAGAASAGFESRSSGYTAITRDGGQPLEVRRLTSNGVLIDFRKDNTSVGSISTASEISLDTTTNYVSLKVDGETSGIQYSNSGTRHVGPWLNFDGAVDLGRSNGRFKDLYLSGGVYLGGTGASNQLDDYEEGAWVPTIKHEADTNLSVGYASAFNHGRYVKIGTIVYFQFTVSLTSVSGGASNQQLIINNMPFTAKSYQTNANGGAFMHYQSNLNTAFTYGIMLGNQSNLRLYSAPNTPSYGNTLTSSSHFQGYGQYETAS